MNISNIYWENKTSRSLKICYIRFVVAAYGLAKDTVGHFLFRILNLFSIEAGGTV